MICFSRSGWTNSESDTGEDQRQQKMSSQEYSIPSELQETLLDFTVHYLVERPPDIIDFAMDYFGELQNKRNGAGGHSEDDEEMDSDDDIDFGELK